MTKDGKLGWELKRFGHVITQPEPALSSVPRAAECAPLPAPETPSRKTPFYKSLNRLFALIHQVIMLCPGWKGLEKVTKAEQFSGPAVVNSSEVFWRKQAEKLRGSRDQILFYRSLFHFLPMWVSFTCLLSLSTSEPVASIIFIIRTKKSVS